MDWEYILTSISAGLILSLITFIFGLKVGKNKSDRPKLKELYKSILGYFTNLFEKLDSTKPLQWSDFETNKSPNNTKTTLYIDELNKKGELVDLNIEMKKQMLEIEREIIATGSIQAYKYVDLEGFIFDYIIEYLGDKLIKEQYSYTTNKNAIGKSFIEMHYGVFFNDKIFDSFYSRLKDNKLLSVNLHFNKRSGKIKSIMLYIDDDGDNRKIMGLILQLNQKIAALEYVEDIKNKKHFLIEKQYLLMEKIERKAKNPHSFSETVFGAIKDVFC